jgi:RimJ/RimL family protein N-acetyltransferase
VNLEAKLLLLNFAFDQLGLIRIEFHTDARNARSRTSLERLGATLEGVLRAHQITRNGSLRDSAVYSIVASEWPQVRAGIADRLLRHG